MESRRTPLSESATNARVQAKPADQPVKQQSLAFRALSPLDDPELADAAVQTLSEVCAHCVRDNWELAGRPNSTPTT